MTHAEAVAFLVDHPQIRKLLDELDRGGILENMEGLFPFTKFADGTDDETRLINIIAVAKAAGYKTGIT